jgi:hypothetical protein
VLKASEAEMCELHGLEVVQMVGEMFEAIIVWLVIVLSESSLFQEYVHYSQLWRDVHRVLWVYAVVYFSFFRISFLFLL